MEDGSVSRDGTGLLSWRSVWATTHQIQLRLAILLDAKRIGNIQARLGVFK